MKPYKKVSIVLILIAVVFGIGIFTFFRSMENTTSVYNNYDFSNLDLSKVEDGTYTGSEDGKLVKATIEATVKNHEITEVKILSHDCGKGKPAEIIVDDIVEKNSLMVDAISGATYSSNVIKVAIYNALTR